MENNNSFIFLGFLSSKRVQTFSGELKLIALNASQQQLQLLSFPVSTFARSFSFCGPFFRICQNKGDTSGLLLEKLMRFPDSPNPDSVQRLELHRRTHPSKMRVTCATPVCTSSMRGRRFHSPRPAQDWDIIGF